MPLRIILVSCGKKKTPVPVPAKDLYISPAFASRRAIAETEGDRWFILSGLHGLVDPEAVIEPYEKDLNDAGKPERRAWSTRVVRQVTEELGDDLRGATIEILAGDAYCNFGLKQGLEASGASVEWPVRGMRQGEQGSYYSRRAAGRSLSRTPTSSDRVSPTYEPLYRHLLASDQNTVSITFADIERLLGRSLPPSARNHRAWWSGSVAPSSWRGAGWSLAQLDLRGESATFVRSEPMRLPDPVPVVDPPQVPTLDEDSIDRAVGFLTDPANAESAATFPSRGQKVDLPGLYSWWADEHAREMIGGVLGATIPPLIYSGQAGAGTNADLKQRIMKTHIGGRITRSTFRLTLAAVLGEGIDLELIGPEELTLESEGRLTEWVKAHLSVAVFPYEDRSTLRAFEEKVIRRIDAPLNLSKMNRGDVRNRLTELRRAIRRGT